MLRLSRIIAIGYIAICLAALAGTALLGPLGYAPFPLTTGPARPPILVTIWYGTEKKEWLEEAKKRFDATSPTLNGRPIQVQLKGLGSREIAERVLAQNWGSDTPPTAISPASSLWLDTLNVPIVRAGADAPQPLVNSPLVIVAWEERAQALWPSGPKDFWHELQTALASDSWKAIGGKETWGPVKFGHTSPLTSNSGTQLLISLAYGFQNKSSGLTTADVNNPEFKTWLAGVESAVSSVGDSTGTFMDDIIRSGPSKYDFAVVYENLALQNMDIAKQRQGQALRIYYPPATLLSDHPFAMLDGDWIKPEERAAAGKFRDFLRSDAMQQLALQYGFRPADPNVDMNGGDANNPFKKYAANGVQTLLAPQAEIPPADVINALLQVWQAGK